MSTSQKMESSFLNFLSGISSIFSFQIICLGIIISSYNLIQIKTSDCYRMPAGDNDEGGFTSVAGFSEDIDFDDDYRNDKIFTLILTGIESKSVKQHILANLRNLESFIAPRTSPSNLEFSLFSHTNYLKSIDLS